MRFQRIYEAVHYRPWFLTSSGYASVRELLDSAMSGKLTVPEARDRTLDEAFSDFVRKRPDWSMDKATGVAEIAIFGVLGQHLSNIEQACGNTGYEEIVSEIEEAISAGANAIIFTVDSPGGMCLGCDEVAQTIKSCGVPTVAFTDSLMCSAAYYLAAGCERIVATKSAIVGNIGVILPWVDASKLWELEGLEFQPIVNDGADLKDTMHGPSITDSQRSFLQNDVNRVAELFHDHVLLTRDDIKSEVFRAGWYSGEEAMDRGLIDVIGDRKLAYDEAVQQV